MAFHVYILQSQTTGRYYCGQTDDLTRRVRQHNDPDYRGSRTTKVFPGPWDLVWSNGYETRGDAMRMERWIKKRGIWRFLENR
jgi:putative endonuclease